MKKWKEFEGVQQELQEERSGLKVGSSPTVQTEWACPEELGAQMLQMKTLSPMNRFGGTVEHRESPRQERGIQKSLACAGIEDGLDRLVALVKSLDLAPMEKDLLGFLKGEKPQKMLHFYGETSFTLISCGLLLLLLLDEIYFLKREKKKNKHANFYLINSVLLRYLLLLVGLALGLH